MRPPRSAAENPQRHVQGGGVRVASMRPPRSAAENTLVVGPAVGRALLQ